MIIIFLYFSKDNDHLGRVIVDLKISFKEPRTYFLDDNYICFTPHCSKNNYKCTFNSKKIDSDSSKNLIKYNGINIEIINKFEYYEPSSYDLYIIYYKLGETDVKNGIIFFYNLCLSFVIINISMRIIKLILFCIIDCVGGLGKFFSHLMMVIIHLINFSFVVTLNELYADMDSPEIGHEEKSLLSPFPDSVVFLVFSYLELPLMMSSVSNVNNISCIISGCCDYSSDICNICRNSNKILNSKKKEKEINEKNLNEIKKDVEELSNILKLN